MLALRYFGILLLKIVGVGVALTAWFFAARWRLEHLTDKDTKSDIQTLFDERR